ncbi:hypothetical protein CEE36_01645 [candidate division TA06 bacterium B3_TA06]|uniref:FlgD Ig-like domain-containing protein n=1 Tax=candidate division TA06 bacterium B3_TA06 TaxID=2012487 RepID=A0A532V9J8_UNCT6|nr:MAG: hypothetical protein CEE36_01645 [candidate division TA06 bacterium B3_TA06]
MRRVVVIVSILLLGGVQIGLAQAVEPSDVLVQDYVERDTTRPAPLFEGTVEQTHYVGKLDLPMIPQEEDTFATFAYTYGDIVIFSYGDSNYCRILNDAGDSVWSGVLMNEEYVLVKDIPWGVYEVLGSKEFSVLSGDPFVRGLGTWYAVDQNSRPLSTKLLSVGPKSTGIPANEAILAVFAYHNNTHVVVRNMENQTVIWEGDLDSAEYYLREGGDVPPIVYSVEATRPVSTMTSCGVNGMYVPAFNGTFTGRDFMTYQHMWGTAPQDIQFVPWEDETWVTVTDLNNPADTIRRIFCEKRGKIKGFAVPLPTGGRPLYIHADKDISVSQTEWTSFGIHHVAFYMVRGIDRDGLGLGKEFYIPLQASVSWSDIGLIYSRLHVIAFSDSTDVKVTRTPKSGGNEETTIYEGTLDRGEFYRYSCPLDDADAVAIYHVTTSEGVATMGSCLDRQGSDFLPLWFAIHPAVAAYPDQFKDTECLVSTSQTDDGAYEVYVENNGNIWDVINIFTENSDSLNFSTSLSDELGRTLPDVDGDGNPDTDTLPKGGNVLVLADVTPSDTVPFGAMDTCFFSVVSMRDTTRLDTAFLVTTILEVSIEVGPDTVRESAYPDESAVFSVYALNTSLYREDTVNLTWSSNKDPVTWPVELVGLSDSDGDGNPDVPNVLPEEIPAPFQVRVDVPDTAMAGDSAVIHLAGASVNYPSRLYPVELVADTAVLIVTVNAVPDLLIIPDTLDSVPSGQTIRYPLKVSNYGNGPDVPDITFEPGQSDWVHRLVDKDGINDLADTDGDDIPDLDTLAGLVGGVPGFDMLYLDVTPPYWALPGLFDSTIVYARSSISDTVYDSAIVVTRTRNIVALDIEPDTGTIIGPGEEAVYLLRVTNLGSTYDIIDIGSYAAPDLGWSHTLSFEDGTPLLDEDNDGVPDLGSVDSAKMVVARLVVRPHEELGSIAGAFDTTVTEHRIVWIRTYYTDDPTLVNDSVLIMTRFEPVLDIHNYPNPFSGSTTFAFSIPRAGLVTLRIYNRAGEHIRTLIDEVFYEFGGIFEAHWDGLTESGHRPAPGVYIYTLGWRERRTDEESEEFSTAQRITKAALLQP